jgi:hypothetical protein
MTGGRSARTLLCDFGERAATAVVGSNAVKAATSTRILTIVLFMGGLLSAS